MSEDARLRSTVGREDRLTRRQQCSTDGCFASFSGGAALDGEIRRCNRAGPDGGHASRWDGQRWQRAGGVDGR
jgi:hypothetical protein